MTTVYKPTGGGNGNIRIFPEKEVYSMSAKSDLQSEYNSFIGLNILQRAVYLAAIGGFAPGDLQNRVNTTLGLIDKYNLDEFADGKYLFTILVTPGTWQDRAAQYLNDLLGKNKPILDLTDLITITTTGKQTNKGVLPSSNKKQTTTTTQTQTQSAGWENSIKSFLDSIGLNIDPLFVELGLAGFILYSVFKK